MKQREGGHQTPGEKSCPKSITAPGFPPAPCVDWGDLRGQTFLSREVIPCSKSLSCCTSLLSMVMSPQGAEQDGEQLAPQWGTYCMEQVPGNARDVQPRSLMERSGQKAAKCVIFCSFHPHNCVEYNREDYLDSSLTLFSHYSSSSKDGGAVKQF